MNADEILEKLNGLFATLEIDGNEPEQVQSVIEDDSPLPDSAQGVSPEDTRTYNDDIFSALVEKLDARDRENNARIDKLEKVVAQMLNKSVTSATPEPDSGEPDEYVPLLDLDFATPAPKQ